MHSHHEPGGASRDRTDDPLLAKQVLSQLSYGPVYMVGLGGLELPTSPLSGVRSNHLSYRPNGVGIAARIASCSLSIHDFLQVSCVGARQMSAICSKGGDPAAPSDTATLLRLHPSHRPHRGKRPPCG
jgi:hypothetical protein